MTHVQDDHGHPVNLSRPAQRIVSLLPSLTETVCVLGACTRLVGVDRYSNWPASVRKLPRMGGGIDPNIEAIVAARPDLVLMAGSTRGAERLEALGLTVLRLEPRTVEDVQRVMNTIAHALGINEAVSKRLWHETESNMSSAIATVSRPNRSRSVYFEVDPAAYGASDASFIGGILKSFGLRNILTADMGPFPKINPEFVVRAQPDIIMLADSSRQTMLLRPGWKSLQAVKQDQLCVFDQASADVLVRAGPRLAKAAQLIAGCLQRLAKAAP